jgi:hypothetical protein
VSKKAVQKQRQGLSSKRHATWIHTGKFSPVIEKKIDIWVRRAKIAEVCTAIVAAKTEYFRSAPGAVYMDEQLARGSHS